MGDRHSETSTTPASGKNKSDANSPDKNLTSDNHGKNLSTNGTPQKRLPKMETLEKSSKGETSGKNDSSDKMDLTGDGLDKMSPKVDDTEKNIIKSSGNDLDAEES